MTLSIELPDDIYEAVRLEAEAFGDTAKTRIERMIERTHRHRVTHPRAETIRQLDELLERGELKQLRDYLPGGKDV